MSKENGLERALPEEVIMSKILIIRGQKVMIDQDLAELYEVETKALKQAVKRNIDIFPNHFMFELTESEFKNLRSQIVTSKWGSQRYLPFAFTEHGVLQLANVLRTRKWQMRNLIFTSGPATQCLNSFHNFPPPDIPSTRQSAGYSLPYRHRGRLPHRQSTGF